MKTTCNLNHFFLRTWRHHHEEKISDQLQLCALVQVGHIIIIIIIIFIATTDFTLKQVKLQKTKQFNSTNVMYIYNFTISKIFFCQHFQHFEVRFFFVHCTSHKHQSIFLTALIYIIDLVKTLIISTAFQIQSKVSTPTILNSKQKKKKKGAALIKPLHRGQKTSVHYPRCVSESSRTPVEFAVTDCPISQSSKITLCPEWALYLEISCVFTSVVLVSRLWKRLEQCCLSMSIHFWRASAAYARLHTFMLVYIYYTLKFITVKSFLGANLIFCFNS